MAKTKSQKQQNYIECLKTKDKAAYLESEWKQKKKKLEQLKKGEAANKSSLKKKYIGKVVMKVIFHLVDKLKAGHKASIACLMRLKSANISGFHKCNKMAMNTLNLNRTPPYIQYTK